MYTETSVYMVQDFYRNKHVIEKFNPLLFVNLINGYFCGCRINFQMLFCDKSM